MPTLNEVDGMKIIMPQIKRGWVDQTIILDGGSTDGTLEYARKMGYQVVVQKKPGLMNAYRESLDYITGDIIITFSPDGNSIPQLLPDLVAKMKEGYDTVIVSRYKDGAKSYDDTWLTALGNWVFTALINLLFGGKYTDAMGIYRAYRKDLIKELHLGKDYKYSVERLFGDMISWEPQLSMRCAKRKKKIGEIPGDEPGRVGGKGKCAHFSWGAVYLLQMLQEFLFYWR